MANVTFQSCEGCAARDCCAVRATYEAQCTEIFTTARMPLIVDIKCEFFEEAAE